MLERLDQAYQQATRFSADASHELRTPLAIMRSELEAQLNGQDMPQAFRERIGSILEENERLSNIVEALFSLARLDGGEAKIGNDVFDLAELVKSTLEQMHLLAEEKTLSVIVSAPQPVFVMGDAARLKQVIVNLLDNAIKYTMPGGTVSIIVGTAGLQAVLSVNDNGVGIPPDALPHIFERFYRADKVRSRTIQGAGLGLSIVRAICQAHGGTVEANSQEGISTSLIVKLPLAAKPNS
jgi:signal transduction histidine kinase